MTKKILGLLIAGLMTAWSATKASAIEIASRVGGPGPVNINVASAIQFTTSDVFENVTIEALISASSGLPGSGTVYLTTSFGPGTTVADEIVHVTLTGIAFITPATPLTLLFSGLTLAPDTYFLILASEFGHPGLGWAQTASPTTTTAAGVTIGADLASTGLAAYAPASASFEVTGARQFRVTGDPVAVPEPSTLALMAMGGILTLAASRRRLNRPLS
jgi:hypothetical protein